MEDPFLILGKEANFEERIDGYLLVKVWWIEVGLFILEVTQREVAGARFTGKLYCGTGQTGIALDTREAARDWVEQEAKRRAREMVELATNNTESTELARVQVLARVERGGRIVVEKVD